MKKYLFLLVFINALLASCCKTNVDPLQHVNKFTCKVNGVFWEAVPNERDILGNDLRIDKSPFFEIASIFANNAKKQQSINVNLSLSDSIKVFLITSNNPFGDYSGVCNVYNLDTLSSRKISVTEHDKIKKIIKGTFAFRAINKDIGCVDTVTVTDGFFDMQY